MSDFLIGIRIRLRDDHLTVVRQANQVIAGEHDIAGRVRAGQIARILGLVGAYLDCYSVRDGW